MSNPSSSSSSSSVVTRVRSASLAWAAHLAWFPPLLARSVIGLVFVLSGWGKLHNLDKVIEYFRTLGIPAPELQAPFAAAMEFACGLAVLVGFLTRLAAVPLIVIMVVALRTAFASQLGEAQGVIEWLNALFGLPEFLYIVALVWLALGGAGALSLDRLLFRRRADGGPGVAR